MNWGHKIAIVYVLFMAFMIGMLFLSRNYDHELVTEDYYAKELAYQDKIDAGNNLAQSDMTVKVIVEGGDLKVQFIQVPEIEGITGEVILYKPDNERLDKSYPIRLAQDEMELRIPSKDRSGRYRVQVNFELNGKKYYKEKELVL
jgi:hypothetical protein